MAGRFDYFVVLAGMRTGSNFLERNLNAVPDVQSFGELYNPYFIAHEKHADFLGVSLPMREADPFVLIERIKAEARGIAGFRLFHDHDPRVRAKVLADPRCAKIILTRSPLESYVSWKQALATDQWILTDANTRVEARVVFDPAEFTAYRAAQQGFIADIRHSLQVSGQTAFELTYDTVQDLDVLNGVLAYLGSRHSLPRLERSLKKQNPAPLRDRVQNYDAMLRELVALDPMGLEAEQVFEPGRGPGVPHFQVLDDPALIYLPLGMAGTDPVAAWLAAQGPVTTGLAQKDLRAWMRAHPGHRKVCVLCHPVARAFAAFRHLVLPHDLNAFADLRAGLRAVYDVPLPDRFDPDAMDMDAIRAGFVAFLGFLKANLAGQTSLRIDRAWASQLTILQGVAQVVLPDRILRWDEMGQLADLAARAPAPSPACDPLLRDLYDAQIERAARAAYARDYQVFGFSDWSA